MNIQTDPNDAIKTFDKEHAEILIHPVLDGGWDWIINWKGSNKSLISSNLIGVPYTTFNEAKHVAMTYYYLECIK